MDNHTDTETQAEVESRIKSLYASLIRAEIKLHLMKDDAKQEKPSLGAPTDWSAA